MPAPSVDGRSPTARDRVVSVEIDGRLHEVRLRTPAPPWAELARRHRDRSKGLSSGAAGAITSPMQGTVLSVAVADGEAVATGDLICVVEAMKMENEIVSASDGVVSGLAVSPGDQVASGQTVCVIVAE